MSVTNKGAKWEIKNTLFMILAFIPILNAFTFFI